MPDTSDEGSKRWSTFRPRAFSIAATGLGESLICDDPRLFVPTAWFGPTEAGSEKDPQAGCLFAFKPGVRDLPENRYAG
jgi:hypothetical protein